MVEFILLGRKRLSEKQVMIQNFEELILSLLLNFLGAVPLARCHWAQECYQGFSGTFLPKLICSQLSFNHRRSAVHVVRNFALFADVVDRVVAN